MQGEQGQLKEVWAVLGQRALYLAWLPQGPENTLMTGFQDCNEKDTHTCTHTRAAPVHKHKKLCIIVTGYPTYVFQGLEMTGEALDQVAAIIAALRFHSNSIPRMEGRREPRRQTASQRRHWPQRTKFLKYRKHALLRLNFCSSNGSSPDEIQGYLAPSV